MERILLAVDDRHTVILLASECSVSEWNLNRETHNFYY